MNPCSKKRKKKKETKLSFRQAKLYAGRGGKRASIEFKLIRKGGEEQDRV